MNGHKILYSGAVLGSTYYGISNGVQYLHYVVLTACILMFFDYRIPWVKTSLIDSDGNGAQESILLVYVAWRAGTTTLSLLGS